MFNFLKRKRKPVAKVEDKVFEYSKESKDIFNAFQASKSTEPCTDTEAWEFVSEALKRVDLTGDNIDRVEELVLWEAITDLQRVMGTFTIYKQLAKAEPIIVNAELRDKLIGDSAWYEVGTKLDRIKLEKERISNV